jgi:uncharacterized protein (UPF0335 family)
MSEGNIAADQLRLFIERIERLNEEKSNIADDIKDVYGEAKATGYDAPTMRKIVALRKLEKHVRLEAEALLETYKAALGMDDMFAGHDGRAEINDRSFKAEVTERLTDVVRKLDDDPAGCTLTTGEGVVLFENKAAKAKRKAASA